MQRAWLRSFIHDHRPACRWLGVVGVTTVAATLALSSHTPGSIYALLAVPLLALTGLGIGLAELLAAMRRYRGDRRNIVLAMIGTVGIGIIGMPLMLATAFATFAVSYIVSLARDFPTYRQVVVDIQRGAITPTGRWQASGSVHFLAEHYPTLRVIFSRSGDNVDQSSVVYDPGGGVAAPDPGPESAGDTQHNIADVTLIDCHTTLVAGYYRCSRWETYQVLRPTS